MSHIAITLHAGKEQSDLLIAQLSELGFEGFEEQPDVLIGYIAEKDFIEADLQRVLEPYGGNYKKETILPVNWNTLWESNFQPVVVEDCCGIRAAFHPPFYPRPTYDIIITPKMAFGTGHHATTASMIKLMQYLSFTGLKVFDFGTGTGILSILAELMGAAAVDAIDHDEWAVNNTLENLEANQSSKVKVWQADTLNGINGSYDILLANINCNVLLRFMADMRSLITPNGKLLLSGIMCADEEKITQAAACQGFMIERKIVENNWLAMQFTGAIDEC